MHLDTQLNPSICSPLAFKTLEKVQIARTDPPIEAGKLRDGRVVVQQLWAWWDRVHSVVGMCRGSVAADRLGNVVSPPRSKQRREQQGNSGAEQDCRKSECDGAQPAEWEGEPG